MAIIYSMDEKRPYVLKSDRDLPENDQTIWYLKALSMEDRSRIREGATDLIPGRDGEEDRIRVNLGSVRLRALRRGLAGVENLRDQNGNIVPFEEDRVGSLKGVRTQASDKFLDKLPDSIVNELVEAITEGNTLEEEDRKNSQSEQ